MNKIFILALTLPLIVGCGDTRDKIQAVASQESASAADDWNESVKWAYCNSTSTGSKWRECGYDFNSACWMNFAATCSGVRFVPPPQVGEPAE